MTQSSIPVNVPIPPMPPGIIALQYSPIWYQNAPSPLPPVTASLPRDRTAIKEHAEKRQLQEKERQLEAKKKKGILGKIESAVENIAVQIEKGVHSITADVSHQWSGLTHESMDKSFRYYLRFPWEERLWEGYDCKVLTGGAAVSGTIFISDNYLSFAGEKKKERLVFVVPLRNIVSIQPARVAKQPGSLGSIPVVLESGQETTVSEKNDAILVYGCDKALHQFYEFGRNFDDAYTVLDRAWRAAMSSSVIPPQPIPLNQPFPQKPRKYYHSYYHGPEQPGASGMYQQPVVLPATTAQPSQFQPPPPVPTYAPYPTGAYSGSPITCVGDQQQQQQAAVVEPRTNVSPLPHQG